MKLPYGFFRGKPLNILEDVAHIFIGLVPMLGWLREHWQWPPGQVRAFPNDGFSKDPLKPYVPLDRVADSYRDFLGYAIGSTLRTVALVAIIIRLAV